MDGQLFPGWRKVSTHVMYVLLDNIDQALGRVLSNQSVLAFPVLSKSLGEDPEHKVRYFLVSLFWKLRRGHCS